jgi:hypothetical protein
VYCTVEGAATNRFGGPPINRATRGGVDPIPLCLPPVALTFTVVSFSLLPHRSDLATVVLPRPPVQLPAPANCVLAPPLRAVLLLRMHVVMPVFLAPNKSPTKSRVFSKLSR